MGRSKCRTGFTIVELLVVVAIILILLGLLVPVVAAAMDYAKRASTRMEMSQLRAAFIQYKQDWSVYPPDRNEDEDWDSGQCLVYYLGTRFVAGEDPVAPWADTITGPASRSGGPYFDFPPERLRMNRFVDAWGTQREGTVYYYQFDNNEAEDGADPETPVSTYNWNPVNVHPGGVDIWCAGPDAVDEIVPMGADLNANLGIDALQTALRRLDRIDDILD